ncbi:efflux RND transporter periplasmic adaptor subunit [Chitinimonas sp. BJYL2]|uniref:efflux RND transporter periplasmic adaptor subunit n=1 Tax=Chitinimonas sp. BJYL2 TaxID=2976696 RepID=UPI0022B4D28D|nr:efflux RND transporter periplasmic adaptor subunit [Chitinimonas sp. BJYL2]
MKRTLLYWLIPATVVLAVGAFWLSRPGSVAVVSPTVGEAIEAIYASGQIEPGVQLPIAPRNAGYVAAVLAREGDAVKRGQVLIRLQDDDLANGEAELAARADLARRQWLRAQDLRKQGFVSQAELDRSRSEQDAAQAALARSQSQRRFLQLTAPADGLILKRDVEVGQFVNVGQPLLYLSCCAPLRVSAEVDEEDISRVQIGQPVLLRADALGDAVIQAEVAEITPKGDPVSRSYRVRMKIAEPDRFRVGMTVDANIVLARRQQALLLPRTAVSDQQVWRVQDGKLLRSKVVTGATTADKIEIRSGIGAQDQIVVKPLDTFKPGQRVRTTPAA